jgi:hypothetical protein
MSWLCAANRNQSYENKTRDIVSLAIYTKNRRGPEKHNLTSRFRFTLDSIHLRYSPTCLEKHFTIAAGGRARLTFNPNEASVGTPTGIVDALRTCAVVTVEGTLGKRRSI